MNRSLQTKVKASSDTTASFIPQQSRLLQRSSTDYAEPATVPSIVHEVLCSSGQPIDPATRTFMEPRFGHDFSRVRVHNDAPKMIQTKLTIGQSNDRYEQEADRVADAVMRMPEPRLQRQAEPEEEELVQSKLAADAEYFIQRQVDEEEEEEEFLQTKELTGHNAGITPAIESRINVTRGGGQPLPESTCAFFEPRFGHDFSQVRVHSDSEAVQMNRELNAQAFTYKQDIYFGMGRFPGTNVLTAHELAHVAQQTGVSQGRAGSVPATIQRMLACPTRLEDTDPTPAGWQSYHGDPSVFHCGFRGILEDRNPTPDDLQNECFYDHSGALVDENHPYAGCRGTPNQYDSRQYWGIPHATIDPGGIVRAGAPAYITSRFHDLMRPISSAIEVVSAAGHVIESIAAGFGEFIALGVLTAKASVDPGNWSFQGLPTRSVGHLNMMGLIIGSAALSQNVDTLLRNLTRRLDSFPIAELLDEIAEDINQALHSRGVDTQRVTSSDLGALSLIQLVEWLRVQGIMQYLRMPEDIAREQLAAQMAATP
ncbi:MAG: DUF4157 domain-containing protein [Euryarchaeota archaeon]|nr:DUF4157 domain-containing protein [Euryarchaeota archaeon]